MQHLHDGFEFIENSRQCGSNNSRDPILFISPCLDFTYSFTVLWVLLLVNEMGMQYMQFIFEFMHTANSSEIAYRIICP